MKRKLTAVLALSILGAAGAFAGNGGPVAAGDWEGLGQAIYMDGTTAEIVVDSVTIFQEGNFVYGNAKFTVKVGGGDPQELPGISLSGYIHGNVLKGTFGFCMSVAPPDCVGAAIFEGRIAGNTLSGTAVDLSDGSTSVVTLHRIAD